MGTEEKSATARAGPASGGGFSASKRASRPGVGGNTVPAFAAGWAIGRPWIILLGFSVLAISQRASADAVT
jgi:hypothetical protein